MDGTREHEAGWVGRCARTGLASALVCVLWALVAAAQVQADAPARSVIARAAFDEGVRAAQRGELREAKQLFERSLAHQESASALLNLAIVQGKLGEPLAALVTLDALDRVAGTTHDGRSLERSTRLRAELEPLIATLELTIAPPQARLLLDGTALREGSSLLRLRPGTHTLRAEAAGHEAQELVLSLAAGERRRETFKLATVSQPLPIASPEPSIGPHETRAVAPTSAPPRPPADAPLPPRWRRALWIGAAVIVVAGGGVALAVTLPADEPAPPSGARPF